MRVLIDRRKSRKYAWLKLFDEEDDMRAIFSVRGLEKTAFSNCGQDMYKIIGEEGGTLGHLWLVPGDIEERWE